ncbi:hypothetical protein WJX72_011647 [[Myrmecia] bisecta]|uniref:Uncharacterized protein n=1 Tax=[Myrmecia] bisecta TaxID=41462 RepID=A0AAW1PSS9_9CHLO
MAAFLAAGPKHELTSSGPSTPRTRGPEFTFGHYFADGRQERKETSLVHPSIQIESNDCRWWCKGTAPVAPTLNSARNRDVEQFWSGATKGQVKEILERPAAKFNRKIGQGSNLKLGDKAPFMKDTSYTTDFCKLSYAKADGDFRHRAPPSQAWMDSKRMATQNKRIAGGTNVRLEQIW